MSGEPLSPGQRVGGYEVQRLVAEGGTLARVYEATDAQGARYALKVLRSTLEVEPQLLARFEREARVLSDLEHPHVPRLLASGEEDSLRFLVFAYLDHQTLAEAIASEGQWSPAQVIELLRACGSALQAVHALGILHRDVKPSNILVLSDGSIKLIDFGLALIADSSQLTHTDEVVGTYGYVAPEALMSDKSNLSGRADIYSLGCVAFEALTGRPVFDERVLIDLVAAHMGRPAPDARSRVPETPAPLANLLDRMLGKDPPQRPDAAALLAALDDLE